MRLLISSGILAEIIDFSNRYGKHEIIFDELKIDIFIQNISLSFYQAERYDKSIICYFYYSNNVGFFFEDIYLALNAKKFNNNINCGISTDTSEILLKNDYYIHEVLHFCKKNFSELTKIPPSWFRKATKIVNDEFEKNFPNLADEDLLKKQELWKIWTGKNLF